MEVPQKAKNRITRGRGRSAGTYVPGRRWSPTAGERRAADSASGGAPRRGRRRLKEAGHRSPMRGHSGGGPGTRNEAAASENPPLPTNRNTHNFLEKEPPPSLCALFENSGDVAGRAGVDGVCYGGSLEEEQPSQPHTSRS